MHVAKRESRFQTKIKLTFSRAFSQPVYYKLDGNPVGQDKAQNFVSSWRSCVVVIIGRGIKLTSNYDHKLTRVPNVDG